MIIFKINPRERIGVIIVLAIVIIPLLTSCASIFTRRVAGNEPELPRIYPGVTTSLHFIGIMPDSASHINNDPFAFVACAFGGIGIIDLPFSFALDTILLPTDLIFGPGAIIAVPKPKQPSEFDSEVPAIEQ